MMLLRLLVPAALAGDVLGIIDDHVGTANLIVVKDVGPDAGRDLVEVEVAREAVDDLVDRLCDAGLDRSGAISVLAPEFDISRAGRRAEREAPGSAMDAVVWREVAARTGEDAQLTGVFLSFLIIATVLAAIGVITDSVVTIVGAMVVGPEFGPLAALAVGIVVGRWKLARAALFALGVGFLIAMAVTAGLVGIGRLTGTVDVASLDSLGRATDFIFHPGVYSLIVALLAGAVGMLSLTSGKSAALVGVFISVTTVPAAGYVSVAIVVGEPEKALGSLVQLLVNMAGIVVAAALVLIIRRITARRSQRYLRRAGVGWPGAGLGSGRRTRDPWIAGRPGDTQGSPPAPARPGRDTPSDPSGPSEPLA